MATINTPTGWGKWWKTKRGELVDGTKNEVSEALNIPQELKDYREAWKEKIWLIDTETKNKIIKAAEKIPVKIETDSDGSKLVEFKLWNKTYKILNPNLKTHSDNKYKSINGIVGEILLDDDVVPLEGMIWDDVDKWENKKLKEYVKEKQSQWLHIPTVEEIWKIFSELINSSDLYFMWYEERASKAIAMLMYLTGMSWKYWLSMWTSDESNIHRDIPSLRLENKRSMLVCKRYGRALSNNFDSSSAANLCMIACE